MRAYNTADIFTVLDIFNAAMKGGSKLDGLLRAAGVGGGDGAPSASATQSDDERLSHMMALISYVLGECLAKCQEKLVAWFASLNEMTVEEFNARPPELLLGTIDHIVTGQESKDFFKSASQLSQKINALVTAIASD
jgi:hypothetical protein